MYPTCRYHPTLAPKGALFTDEAAFAALSEEWVDTPAKFPVETEGHPIIPEETEESPVKPKRAKKEKAS